MVDRIRNFRKKKKTFESLRKKKNLVKNEKNKKTGKVRSGKKWIIIKFVISLSYTRMTTLTTD